MSRGTGNEYCHPPPIRPPAWAYISGSSSLSDFQPHRPNEERPQTSYVGPSGSSSSNSQPHQSSKGQPQTSSYVSPSGPYRPVPPSHSPMNPYHQPYPTQASGAPHTASPTRRSTYPPPRPNYDIRDRYNPSHPSPNIPSSSHWRTYPPLSPSSNDGVVGNRHILAPHLSQSNIVPHATSSSHLDAHTSRSPNDSVVGNRHIPAAHSSQSSIVPYATSSSYLDTHTANYYSAPYYPPPPPNVDSANQYTPPSPQANQSCPSIHSAHRLYPPVRSTGNPHSPLHQNQTDALTVSPSRRASYPLPHTYSSSYDDDDDGDDPIDPTSSFIPLEYNKLYIRSSHAPYHYDCYVSQKPRDPKAFGTRWRPSTPHPKKPDLQVARERRNFIRPFASVEEEEAESSSRLVLEQPENPHLTEDSTSPPGSPVPKAESESEPPTTRYSSPSPNEVPRDLSDQTAALKLGEKQPTPGQSRTNASDPVENLEEEHIASQKLQSAIDNFVNNPTEDTHDCLCSTVLLYAERPQHSLALVMEALQLLNSEQAEDSGQHCKEDIDEFPMLNSRLKSPFSFPEL